MKDSAHYKTPVHGYLTWRAISWLAASAWRTYSKAKGIDPHQVAIDKENTRQAAIDAIEAERIKANLQLVRDSFTLGMAWPVYLAAKHKGGKVNWSEWHIGKQLKRPKLHQLKNKVKPFFPKSGTQRLQGMLLRA